MSYISHMRYQYLFLATLLVSLAACGVDTTGLSPDSSRMAKGSDTALVTVTEYGDFQCPACKGAHTLINKPLVEQYGSRIRFAFKHFPLRAIHPYALEAAEAAECAADQGKFWEFVDLAYEEQENLSSSKLRDWANILGLDEALFDRCVRSNIKEDTILADYKEGEASGTEGTPTYFVNGTKVPSSVDAISAAIDAIFQQTESAPL